MWYYVLCLSNNMHNFTNCGLFKDSENTFKTVVTVDHVRFSIVIRDLSFCKTESELCDISGIIIYDRLKLGLGPKCVGASEDKCWIQTWLCARGWAKNNSYIWQLKSVLSISSTSPSWLNWAEFPLDSSGQCVSSKTTNGATHPVTL